MSDRCPVDFVSLAERLATAAGVVALSHFRKPLEVERKADESPVTIADREAEEAMRGLIEKTFPDHGIMGEEHGSVRMDADFVWTLDPIDGTQSFVTGKPLFGTLIALTHNGRPVLGVIDMPALEERWVGVEDTPTTFNGDLVKTRACDRLDKAWLYATSPHMFSEAEFENFEALRKLSHRAVYGAECYAYGLVATGTVDLTVEADLKPYDYCAMVPIVEGAGGVITDWRGQPLGLKSDGRVIAAGDKRTYDAALEILKS